MDSFADREYRKENFGVVKPAPSYRKSKHEMLRAQPKARPVSLKPTGVNLGAILRNAGIATSSK